MEGDQNIEEIRSELKKLARLTEENHTILKRVDRRARMAIWVSVMKWIIIIGITIGAFYYIQPFLEQISALYQQITGTKVDFMSLFNKIR